MSERPTPETDAYIASQDYSPTGHQWRNFTRKLERERDEVREKAERYRLEANAMMLQRDEARSELSLKQQTLTIAEGTLSDLRKQRDEWSTMCGKYKQERDEAREALASREVVIAQQKVITDLILERNAARESAEELRNYDPRP